jgi:RNA polymerase sigma factor (sigma-70 family)
VSRDEARKLVGSLFDTWYSSLVRYACRACGSLDRAEDVVQETFLALFRELVWGGRVDNPKAWTLCVVRREVVRAHREAARYSYSPLDLDDPLHQLAAPEPATEPEADSEKLDRLLAVLTQREEEVLMLRLRSLKYQQIAQELGIGINSVKTLLARGLRKMREASHGAARPRRGDLGQDANEEPLLKTLQ